MMESICDLGNDDILRACSAILEVLSADDEMVGIYITQTNYLRRHSRNCLSKPIIVNGGSHLIHALKCSVLRDDVMFTPIYAVADPRERGSAFVLVMDENNRYKLYNRVSKIGALLFPLRSKGVKLRSDGDSNAQSKERIRGQTSSRQKQKKRSVSSILHRTR